MLEDRIEDPFRYNRHTGHSYVIHLKITVKVLAEFFSREEETIRRWIRSKELDPTSLDSILAKYLELREKATHNNEEKEKEKH